MIKKLSLLLIVSFSALSVQAQNNLFSPSSTISPYGSVSSPAAENYTKIIDGNVETKFLDFNSTDGVGFTVNLGTVSAAATEMSITMANDFPQRDPQNYQILGSNNGTNFTTVTTGTIVCDATRFNTTTYNFDNTAQYSYYRLIFTNQCNTSEAIFQIAEVQLSYDELNSAAFKASSHFSLYPNPSTGKFKISSKLNKAIDEIIVTNSLGKQIIQVHPNATTTDELDLLGVSSGIYFVQIASGSENFVQKIIIE